MVPANSDQMIPIMLYLTDDVGLSLIYSYNKYTWYPLKNAHIKVYSVHAVILSTARTALWQPYWMWKGLSPFQIPAVKKLGNLPEVKRQSGA